MIWDRFDDAMDDLDRDESAELRAIERLESELRALGLAVPVRPGTGPAPAVRPYDGPQGAYEQRGAEVAALRAHRDALTEHLTGHLAARRRRSARRRLLGGIAALGGTAILGAVLWRAMPDPPRPVRSAARGAAPARLSLDLVVDLAAAGPRDYERMAALVLVLERRSDLALVDGNALAFATLGPRPAAGAAQWHGTATWQPGQPAWALEFLLHRGDGERVWRRRMDAHAGEDDVAFAARAAGELARQLIRAGASAAQP